MEKHHATPFRNNHDWKTRTDAERSRALPVRVTSQILWGGGPSMACEWHMPEHWIFNGPGLEKFCLPQNQKKGVEL